MGYRLAEAARDRGARVVLVSGPTALAAPARRRARAVRSAEEMARAVAERAQAAPTSWPWRRRSPTTGPAARSQPTKVKKSRRRGADAATLVRTPDILARPGRREGPGASWSASRPRRTTCSRTRAEKLRRKNARPDGRQRRQPAGAGASPRDDNAAVLIDARGETRACRSIEQARAGRAHLGPRGRRCAPCARRRVRREPGRADARDLDELRATCASDARYFGELTRRWACRAGAPSGACHAGRAACDSAAYRRAVAVAPAAQADATSRRCATDLGDCQRCKLAGGRKNIVFGQGNPHARLMFVGEAPGADEDEQGLAFVGRAGQLLTDIIEAMGLTTRDDVFIANVLKCRPPGNRNPEPDEILPASRSSSGRSTRSGPRCSWASASSPASGCCKTAEPISRIRGRAGRLQRHQGRCRPTIRPTSCATRPRRRTSGRT